MSQQRIFPFRRVSVDHMIRGVTRVWWQLEPDFKQPGPYVFQLQFGKTGLRNATDWVNIGPPVTNGFLAYDPAWHDSGYDLLSHYRITLTTPDDTYVSQPSSCFGELNEHDWALSREIIRKEQVRNRLVATPGYLVKPMRFGEPCPRCRDQLTQEVTDSDCPVCQGTGFRVGYHPPLAMQCWDLAPQTITEQVDVQLKGTTRDNPYVTARVIGFPALNKNDVWVNAASDERWLVESIQIIAALRNVPIVYNVQLGLMPFSSSIYALDVTGAPPETPITLQPVAGTGSVLVNHNYGGADALAYHNGAGCPIEGATVYVFTAAAYAAAQPAFPARSAAIARANTAGSGRWDTGLQLNPGNYILLFERLGDYGPDVQAVTVTAPVAIMSSSADVAPVLKPSPSRNIPVQTKPAKAADKNDFWAI